MEHLVGVCKAGRVVHAHCAVLQRAVHRELAHALLDAALRDLPCPCEVPDLGASALVTPYSRPSHADIMLVKTANDPLAHHALSPVRTHLGLC